MTLRVLSPGLLTTVQDPGRPGFQRFGVPVGGAMDPVALRIANLLVGNQDGDAGLEVTLGGAALRFEREALVALGGAETEATLDGVPLPGWHPAWVPAGTTLTMGRAVAGCRAYLAVAGGIDVPLVMGSRSTYLPARLGGLEGRALRGGDVLEPGTPSALGARIAAGLRGAAPRVARWGAGPTLRPRYSGRPTVRLLPGEHAGLLAPASRRALHAQEFRVSPRSDRTGYRLDGPRLQLAERAELLSEAVACGTVQLPPDGSPIVLMADRQTTGGYPRLGEVATVDVPLLAQLRPGDRVRFRGATLDEAHALLAARESDLLQARQSVALLHGQAAHHRTD